MHEYMCIYIHTCIHVYLSSVTCAQNTRVGQLVSTVISVQGGVCTRHPIKKGSSIAQQVRQKHCYNTS